MSEKLNIITPEILKGFRDFLPSDAALREHMLRICTAVCMRYGIGPIDTPTLEYTHILLGKGGGENDKQIYRFIDNGGRDVALRFDLTVPFARYVAQHKHDLLFPFRCYHFGRVFRGENTQRGRYREFMQCDVDCVGTDSVSSDVEIITILSDCLDAMHTPVYAMHISHREILRALLQQYIIVDENIFIEILRILDKSAKIGQDKTVELLQTYLDYNSIMQFMNILAIEETNEKTLQKLQKYLGADTPCLIRLSEVYDTLCALDKHNNIIIDISITRGLDYYTGIIFETFIADVSHIGSICSGGRYDNLTALYSKQTIMGIGGSIGLDRLIAAFTELNCLPHISSTACICILNIGAPLAYYHQLCKQLHTADISAHVYSATHKIKKQLQYASEQNYDYALICGTDEYEMNIIKLKNLHEKTEQQYSHIHEFIATLHVNGI